MKRKIVVVSVLIALVLVSYRVYSLSGCAKKEAEEPGAATALAATSADERYPVWSPDGSKIFFKSDDWICVCNPDGSQYEKMAEVKGPLVFDSDMKKVFSAKMIIPKSIVRNIAWNDPKVKGEIKALEDEYGAFVEEEKVGITNNTANLVVISKSLDAATMEEKTYVLDIYIDLRNETVIKVDRIEKAKAPVGEEPKEVVYQAYVMEMDDKNQQKIAELTLEEKYVDDGGYIGSTRAPMYKMYSWSPDRTKIFFTKLEETGYTWVWREEEGKWVRYEAGTEPSVPVVQWAGTEQKLIAKEHERTAWMWDLKDNELRFIGHLSYSIVSYFFEKGVVWSPDGRYVALPSTELSGSGVTEQIFLVNVESGESQRLTSFVGYNAYPEWSPDGRKIMYLRVPPEYWWMPSSLDYDEGYDIWVVDIDGSNEKQLTDIPKNWEVGGWSPDGSKIAYTSWEKSSLSLGKTQEIGIWIMNMDGSDKRLLTKVDTGFIEHMEWSPDGSKIAFVTYELSEGEPRDIYVIDVPAS